MNRKASVRRRGLYLVVGIVVASLIGVQLYWMNTNIRLQQLAAERNLKTDLDNVIHIVEDEAFCFYFYSKAYIQKGQGIYILKQTYIDDTSRSGYAGLPDTLSMYNVFHYGRDTVFDKTNSLNFETPSTVDISLKFKYATPSYHVKKIDTNSYKLPGINTSTFRDALNNSQTLDELINPDKLDSLIRYTLVKNDFDTVYEMGIRRQGAGEYEYLKKGSSKAHLRQATLQFSMLGDNFNQPYRLFLYLPDPVGHILRSMAATMICSIAIILVLIISYAYFVRTILNQKRLSEMKSMFINNITHEFNTPITNIHLAVENWREASANSGFYANIIEQENSHLQHNVEQMLQLAAIEHMHTPHFADEVDVNGLILETVNTFRLQLEKINGEVTYRFEMPVMKIYGDQRLLKVLLHNLTDNAIKYGRDDLKISFETYRAGGKIILEMQDNGIGMSAETVKYMFEPFYRGDKSDRHDVKGFGIGLSYVKYILDTHKGTIRAKSRKGVGTKFTIYFPDNLNTIR